MAEQVAVNEKFVSWLQGELDARHWTRSDLARAGDINPTTLTNIYSGRRNAGASVLRRISKGLDVPEEVVFHAYGMLESYENTDDIITEVMHEMGGFVITDKEEIREYIRMKRRIAEKNGTYKKSE